MKEKIMSLLQTGKFSDAVRAYNEAIENLIDIMGFDAETTKALKMYVVYREKFLAILEEYWEKI